MSTIQQPGAVDQPSNAEQPSAVELGRRAFRRKQTTRSVLISLASTVVVAVVAWFFVINTPDWAAVQQTFFDPAVAVQAWRGCSRGCCSTSGC